MTTPAGLERDAQPRDDIQLASGQLRDLVRARATGVTAQTENVVGAQARVEILHDLTSTEIRSLVTALGGEVYGEVPGTLVEALVPIDSLVELESSPGVQYLRPPLRVNIPIDEPLDVTSVAPQGLAGFLGQEVAKTNADNWHAAGLTGQGVKVGIIDVFDEPTWNAAQSAGEVPPPAGTLCRFFGSSCSIWSSGSVHGVAVAEIIHEMAPSAQVYIADVWTVSDLQAAVNYFASQGVQVISRSLTSSFDGPGDGTGPTADVIDDAVSRGMTWVNAAGNNAAASGTSGGTYWRGSWTDPDNDGWLNFNGADETLDFRCGFLNGVRWNDWGPNPTDYDVYVYDTVLSLFPKAIGGNDQPGGFPPLEFSDQFLTCSGPSDIDYMMIKLFDPGSGTGSDVIEIMGNGTWLEYSQNPYSASGPASDSSSPGMLSVGAIDPPNGTTVAGYSSWGPTNNGTTKPDISAAAGVFSFSYSPVPFHGTSASAPAVSGAAALVIGANLASSPAQVKTYLLNNATVDRGTTGTDNVYGKGELRLPNPPSGATTSPTPGPTVTAAPGSRVWGDLNCSGSSNPVDSLWVLRYDAGLSLSLPSGCPAPGDMIWIGSLHVAWGDVNCIAGVNPVDSLNILRNDAGLPAHHAGGCPDIGQLVLISTASPTPSPTGTPVPTGSQPPTTTATPTGTATTSPTPTSTAPPTASPWKADNFTWYENVSAQGEFSDCNLTKPVPPNDPIATGLCTVFDLTIPEGFYDEHWVLTRDGVIVADELFLDSYAYSASDWHKSFPAPAPPGVYTVQVFMDGTLFGSSTVTVSSSTPTATPVPTPGPTPPPSWQASDFLWYQNNVPLGPVSDCNFTMPVPPNPANETGLCVNYFLTIPNGNYDFRFVLNRNGSVVADFTHENIPLTSDWWSQGFLPPAPAGDYTLQVFVDGFQVGASAVSVGVSATPTPSPTPIPNATIPPNPDIDCPGAFSPIAIPDHDPGNPVILELTNPGGGVLLDLDICINIDHTWVGDLYVEVEHLSTGTTVVLIDQPGVPGIDAFGCPGENIRVLMADEAASAIENECGVGTPTINGAFRPNEALSAFDGEVFDGIWQIRIADHANVDGYTGSVIGATFYWEE